MGPTKNTQQNEILQASVLGTIAFKEGRRIPYHDTQLMKMTEGKAVGESLPIFRAYIKAWDNANLKSN